MPGPFCCEHFSNNQHEDISFRKDTILKIGWSAGCLNAFLIDTSFR